MIYRNHASRCRHGFARGVVRCPVCEPNVSDLRYVPEGERPPRSKPMHWKYRIGDQYGGATLLSRVTNDRVRARCRCGTEFEISRSTIGKHQRAGTTCMCRACTEAANPSLKGLYRGAYSSG